MAVAVLIRDGMRTDWGSEFHFPLPGESESDKHKIETKSRSLNF